MYYLRRTTTMPLISSSPASYRSTADEFIAHWTQTDSAATTNPIVVKGGYTCAALQADRDALDVSIDAVRVAIAKRQIIGARRSNAKDALHVKLLRFKAGVASAFMGTLYAANLPIVPGISQNEKQFLEPLFRMRERWRELNGLTNQVADFTAPFLLGDGTTLAAFESEIIALQNLYREGDTIDAQLDRARRERDALLVPLKERLQQYRLSVVARFGKNDPISNSLPVLTVSTSRTLKPVKLMGQWETQSNAAILTWSASTDADLEGYSVRTTGSLPYKASDEDTIATIPAGTTQWTGTEGLEQAGMEANFKVYTIFKNNRERASNAVKITRPGKP
jgi:hypothetical protein